MCMHSIGMNKTNQIAETIVEQINASRIPNEPYLKFFKAVKASQIVTLEDGIQFRVKGDRFAGKVVIKLSPADLYDIEFWNVSMEPFVCEKVYEMKGIFNDQLLEVLWNQIVIV